MDRRRQPGRPGALRAAACGRRRSGSADAILVSQVVTQKQVHARQLTKLVDLLEAEGLRDRYLLVARRPAALEHVRQGAWVRRRLRARLDALAGRGLDRDQSSSNAEDGGVMEGLTVELRMRLSAADVHYGGNLVDGAHGLEIFGDIVTELAIHTDGDEGLFAGYEKVEFLAPLYGGDFVRATRHDRPHGQHQPHRRPGDLEGDRRPARHQRLGGRLPRRAGARRPAPAAPTWSRRSTRAGRRAGSRRARREPDGDLIITVAPCGAETTREQAPGVPYTPAEIAAEARRAFDAGARMVHVHARWDDGTPTQDADRYTETVAAIRERVPEIDRPGLDRRRDRHDGGGAAGLARRPSRRWRA